MSTPTGTSLRVGTVGCAGIARSHGRACVPSRAEIRPADSPPAGF